MKKLLLALCILSFGFYNVFAQNTNTDQSIDEKDIYLNWHLKSPEKDLIYGAEVNKAYETLLQNKKSTTIIVAVIDGGIDINHIDLKENIWVNANEIPSNGVDDDQNGYIDDLNGWNFLGNSLGENIEFENIEVTRIYKSLKNKYEGKKANTIPDAEKEQYLLYQQAKESYLDQLKMAQKTKSQIDNFESNYFAADRLIKDKLNKDTYDLADLEKIELADKDTKRSVKLMSILLQNDFSINMIDEFKKHNNDELNYHLNTEFEPRNIIGDNIEELTPGYGNNNVYGPGAIHGTFVAGIIAAIRNNDTGIDGIASDVKIMALKAVPDGDERDKDIANAIRYAADNGARIINMSFGKEISPQKHLVDEAVLYAQGKGVLFIHAAGNESVNLDKKTSYPIRITKSGTVTEQWITVGATSMEANLDFVADFSNYGKTSVDLFAPGVAIKSLAPENNYGIMDGTSFSCPVVSGVAALIWSYYPELTAIDIKRIILSSVNKYPDLKVKRPNQSSRRSKKTRFGKLSATSGVVSLFNALQVVDDIKTTKTN
ncbi:MAG: S8 family serine peptidase [Bacteroidales bacterium]